MLNSHIEGTGIATLKRNKYWILVGIYVAIIYTTLSWMPTLVEWAGWGFRYRLGFIVSMFLILILGRYVFYLFFEKKVRRLSSWFLIFSVMAAYGYLLNILWIPQERLHLFEYGFLAFLVYKALKSDVKDGRICLYTSILVASFGCVDELIQFFLPNRYYDIKDILINAASGVMGALMLYAQDRG
jgi:VanZ family protein